jgi:hypothetical protein
VDDVASLPFQLGRHLRQFHHMERRDMLKPGGKLREMRRQTGSLNEKTPSWPWVEVLT